MNITTIQFLSHVRRRLAELDEERRTVINGAVATSTLLARLPESDRASIYEAMLAGDTSHSETFLAALTTKIEEASHEQGN